MKKNNTWLTLLIAGSGLRASISAEEAKLIARYYSGGAR